MQLRFLPAFASYSGAPPIWSMSGAAGIINFVGDRPFGARVDLALELISHLVEPGLNTGFVDARGSGYADTANDFVADLNR